MTNALSKYEIVIIGGGPAGATAAILLKKNGFNVCLIEKKSFPRETLCGEFLSREVVDILHELGLWQKFLSLGPNPISVLRFTDDMGHELTSNLGFTGYGLKRGKFDALLLNEAKLIGVHVLQPAEVKKIFRIKESYVLSVNSRNNDIFEIVSDKVIAAYGKQNQLDRFLNRKFAWFRTGLNGVKFHIPSDLCSNLHKHEIQIYSSFGIYCGINEVGDKTVTVCFLEDHRSFQNSSREHLKSLIRKNRALKSLFVPSVDQFVDCAPVYGSGNIFFGNKGLSENGIIMIGDAARVVAPLAGDGIAMAMQSAKIVSDILSDQFRFYNHDIVKLYEFEWKKKFYTRIVMAGLVQSLILNNKISWPVYTVAKLVPSTLNYIIRSTRN